MKIITFFITSVAVALLTACGGGGSSAPAAETDYVSKYVGTWKTACWTASIYQDTAVTPAANAYLTRTLVFTKTSGSMLALSATDTVYSSADTTCSGTIQAAITRTGLNTASYTTNATNKTVTSSFGPNTSTYVGTVALGAVMGDKLDGVEAPLYSNNNANLSMGTISFSTANFTGGSGKIAFYLNGTTLTMGTGATASTYPNALQTHASGIFTKQ
jgi:hypothetical protein